MKVRTFHVASMHEAIRSIKDTLGPDAVILSTKRVRSWDNGFGLLGGSMLEVMAAIEDDAAVPESAPVLGEDERPASPAAQAPAVPAEESRFQKTLQGAIEQRDDKPRPAGRQASFVPRELPRAGTSPEGTRDRQTATFQSF